MGRWSLRTDARSAVHRTGRAKQHGAHRFSVLLVHKPSATHTLFAWPEAIVRMTDQLPLDFIHTLIFLSI